MSKLSINSEVCGSIHICYVARICSIPKGYMFVTYPQKRIQRNECVRCGMHKYITVADLM